MDRTTIARGTLIMVLLGGICPTALVLLGLRINQMSFSDNKFLVVGTVLMCIGSVAAGVWEVRRQAREIVLPRKSRLEALLKELDAP